MGISVEFDWGCVLCVKTLPALGHQAIVISFNPETASIDYDESDRLYFEELSHESVLYIWRHCTCWWTDTEELCAVPSQAGHQDSWDPG